MNSVPHDVLEAMVQCFGKAFHLRDSVESFFLSSEIPKELAVKDKFEPKYIWSRRLLTELGQYEDGRILQRRVLTNLCNLKDIPDSKVADRTAGIAALKRLRDLAHQHQILIQEFKQNEIDRISIAEQKEKLVIHRATKLDGLRQIFQESVVTPDRQKAGYSLQDFLKELFELNDMEFHKSFRNESNTQEVDGHFLFMNFDYLVEAKWTSEQPNEGEVAKFKHKVDGKMSGTRGLFVSIQGFRAEVAAKFDERGSSIIFMDGTDLVHVLEGRIDLKEGLRKKVESASKRGLVMTPFF